MFIQCHLYRKRHWSISHITRNNVRSLWPSDCSPFNEYVYKIREQGGLNSSCHPDKWMPVWSHISYPSVYPVKHIQCAIGPHRHYVMHRESFNTAFVMFGKLTNNHQLRHKSDCFEEVRERPENLNKLEPVVNRQCTSRIVNLSLNISAKTAQGPMTNARFT